MMAPPRVANFPPEPVDDLIRQIAGSAKQASAELREVAVTLEGIIRQIEEQQVTVNFGGVFKAGKSTMINAAVGRPILPVDDLPDTGAICCLLAGKIDSAVVFKDGKERSIPCTTEAIRKEVTLLSAEGERRKDVLSIERTEIVLKDCVIPQNACWVDSPGYNDTAEMDDRTRKSAGRADVLAWVLTSRQLLSEVEMEFLSVHIQKSGPASVFFILNGFLANDTQEEWQRFLARQVPQLINKVQDFAPDMGFPDHGAATILTVAGRAMSSHGQETFGGSELLRTLLAMDSKWHPRVMQTRLRRAAGALRECAAQAEQSARQRAGELDQKKKAVVEANRQASEKGIFRDALVKIVDDLFEEVGSRLRSCAAGVAGAVASIASVADGSVAAQMNQQMATVAETATRRAVERINDVAQRNRQLALTPDWEKYILSLTRPAAVSIKAPPTVALTTGTIVGFTLLGFVVGIFFFGIGEIPTAILSFLLAKFGYPLYKERQVLPTVVADIRRSAEAGISGIEGQREPMVSGLTQYYSLDSAAAPPPDESSLRTIEALRDRLRHLADQAAKLAEPTTPFAPERPGWKQGRGA